MSLPCFPRQSRPRRSVDSPETTGSNLFHTTMSSLQLDSTTASSEEDDEAEEGSKVSNTASVLRVKFSFIVSLDFGRKENMLISERVAPSLSKINLVTPMTAFDAKKEDASHSFTMSVITVEVINSPYFFSGGGRGVWKGVSSHIQPATLHQL